MAAGGIWLASTASGVLLGSGPATGTPGSTPWKEWLAKSAPWIFIAGLLILLGAARQSLLPALAGTEVQTGTADGGVQDFARDYPGAMNQVSIRIVLAVTVGCLALATLLSWRVDINLFSLYYLYRNRLVRCYLGASRQPQRSPQPFTGFDPDDMALADMVQRPYPIFNTAINLVKGGELAWQQRKAASFSFTPATAALHWPRQPALRRIATKATGPPANISGRTAFFWARRSLFRAPRHARIWATTVPPHWQCC